VVNLQNTAYCCDDRTRVIVT